MLEFGDGPFHLIDLMLKERTCKAWIDIAFVNGDKYHGVINGWKIVGVRPGRCIASGSGMLVENDIELVKVYLRDVRVWSKVNVFGRNHSKDFMCVRLST